MVAATIEKKVPTGKVYITRGVNAEMQSNFKAFAAVMNALARHSNGDWGDLDKEDKASNDTALKVGNRILSRYNNIPAVGSIYIITEWDRSITTILLPEEY